MNPILLKDLNKKEKPREKLKSIGIKALTDEEIIALIIRSGGKNNSAIDVARKIINKFEGFKGILNAELEELTNFNNIGLAKACALKAACEITTRMESTHLQKNHEAQKPEDIYNILRKDLYGKEKEHLYIVSLNPRNRIIAKDLISVGTVNQTLTYIREIYKTALTRNASSIIMAHNHPSNDPTPSEDDLKVTERVAIMGKDIGIPLVDHIIVCDTTFASLKALNLFKTYPLNNTDVVRESIRNFSIKRFVN
jgi:DNA repair protein RadC